MQHSSMSQQPPTVVQLTPAGRGAVATLLVEGRGSAEIVRRTVKFASADAFEDTSRQRVSSELTLARYPADDGEQLVVRCRGAESVELHCHGGLAAAERIIDALRRNGCRRTGWQRWLGSRHGDPAAVAVAALAEARTRRTAAILLDQYNGAFQRELAEIETLKARGETAAAARLVETLLDRRELGRHLTRPWRVVLAGPPNTGKSSLVNALLGYQRAIVHDVPGTTRDVVTAVAVMDGWPVELCDTAGLRDAQDSVESAGVELAGRKLAGADLILLVFDSSRPWTKDAAALADSLPESLLVHNKSDLRPAAGSRPDEATKEGTGTATESVPNYLMAEDVAEPVPFFISPAGPRPSGISTSALDGSGIESLLESIVDRLVPDSPPPGAAVPLTEEQVELLRGLR